MSDLVLKRECLVPKRKVIRRKSRSEESEHRPTGEFMIAVAALAVSLVMGIWVYDTTQEQVERVVHHQMKLESKMYHDSVRSAAQREYAGEQLIALQRRLDRHVEDSRVWARTFREWLYQWERARVRPNEP
jgi:hypothetical protein